MSEVEFAAKGGTFVASCAKFDFESSTCIATSGQRIGIGGSTLSSGTLGNLALPAELAT